jgi:hypothetical protein
MSNSELFIHDKQNQDFYDSFNHFIFSNDSNIFNKLLSKFEFINLTNKVPGDVLELGVFRGSGLIAWLKTLKMCGVNNKKLYGFDFFNQEKLVESINSQDKLLMEKLFTNRKFDPTNYEDFLINQVKSIGYQNFELISGNITETLPNFLDLNPGFRTSLVNFDLDTEDPTYMAMDLLWPRLASGGIFLFDEYAINEWTESNAVDKFVMENGLVLNRTNYASPSAYIVKTNTNYRI